MQRGVSGRLGCLVALLCTAMCGAADDAMRTMRYAPGNEASARAWQAALRERLRPLLRVEDLAGRDIPLEPELGEPRQESGYVIQEGRIRATEARMINMVVARPDKGQPPFPSVVCIHGHGSNRMTPFDSAARQYKQFGAALTRRGFIVVSTDVGQHEVREAGRTLMGERLWDLMRCVDYLQSLPDADPARIGCAGLSLGGEMAMWLAAMDTRIAATVSAGFLTMMDQMEQNHCMCWKFDGLRALVDFPDIYALIAPRPLQCQNGLQEPETQFTVPLARHALAEITPAYADLGAPENVQLHVHPGGHEIDLDAMTAFLEAHLLR